MVTGFYDDIRMRSRYRGTTGGVNLSRRFTVTLTCRTFIIATTTDKLTISSSRFIDACSVD
jgi:hypothetical protein